MPTLKPDGSPSPRLVGHTSTGDRLFRQKSTCLTQLALNKTKHQGRMSCKFGHITPRNRGGTKPLDFAEWWLCPRICNRYLALWNGMVRACSNQSFGRAHAGRRPCCYQHDLGLLALARGVPFFHRSSQTTKSAEVTSCLYNPKS